jgi:hypothetical protein
VRKTAICIVVAAALSLCATHFAAAETWAQKLGWGPNDKVLIIHSDDVGMCHETVMGATAARDNGIVSSMSIMMPCPWVGEIAAYIKQHPDTDAGLHLALTSEWDYYRWGPVAGKSAVPGLADEWGCLWDSNALVAQHASADEVEREIRAQIDRALAFGIKPTHIDSHMGTLFAKPEFFQRYLKVGIEKGIPVLAPDLPPERLAQEAPELAGQLKAVIKMVWDAGLPVIDDVRPDTYDWPQQDKKANYIKLLRGLKPGITEVIVHCAKDTETFRAITSAAPRWIADGKAMLDPELKQIVKDEGIILTGWRELKARRDALGKTTK